ncbi:MAG TPA: four helix bundle protein [Chitinophagaceae bacterium]
MGDYRDLIVFQKAYKLAMDIFELSKKFPSEEKFSLTDQIRRSSRSVCANLVEAYRRRKYKAHFLSKLTDSDTENAETQIWLDFSKNCKYITEVQYADLTFRNEEVGKILWHMIQNPDKFT